MIGVLATIAARLHAAAAAGRALRAQRPVGRRTCASLMPSVVLAIGGFVVGDAISRSCCCCCSRCLPSRTCTSRSVDPVLLAVDRLHDRRAARSRFERCAGHARDRARRDVTAIVTGLIFSQSRLRRVAAANHSLSVTDPLTGLANLRTARAPAPGAPALDARPAARS